MRVFVLALLAAFLIGMALAAKAAARPPVPGHVFKAVRLYWKTPAERRKAFDVIACETGNAYNTNAANGQYLGLFQMGSSERRRCGHGSTARAQARAAHCWYVLTGRDWDAWSCA